MPSTTPVTWAVIGGIGFLVARHFELSPSVVMLLTLFAVLLFGSKRPAGAAEHFTPVFVSSVVAGLQAGVASIQGRRQYMEDIHQTIAFNAHEQPNAARVGLTHFFAVYDGHGGKRAAAWAQQHLVSNLLRERHRIRPGQEDDFSVQNMAAIMEAMQASVKTFTGLLAAIYKPEIAVHVAAILGSFGLLGSASIVSYQGAATCSPRQRSRSRRLETLRRSATGP
jgi:hypothetical protein